MKFQAKSTQELERAEIERKEKFLWQPCQASFEILESDEQNDKNGDGMFKLKVKVYHPDGERSQNLFDYVSGTWMEHKLRHLAEAAGLLSEYESGEIEAYQLVGKTGLCSIKIQKDKTGDYGDKNVISDYVVDKKPTTLQEAIGNDVVPF